MKRYLTVQDLDPDQTRSLIDNAIELKRTRGQPIENSPLAGKHVALFFQKPSVRTRTSFTVGVHELGGHVVELGSTNTKVGKGEHIEDFAKVVGGYVHLLVARVFDQAVLEAMADRANVPLINALSDDFHPCQALADAMTIKERLGDVKGRRVAWVGEGNNVARSLTLICTMLGADVVAAAPEGFGIKSDIEGLIADYPGSLTQVDKPEAAVEGADVVVTDTWISMGQEEEAAERRKIFTGYCVDDNLMSKAADGAIVLHCLPAVRGEEITVEVMYSERSAIWQEAENRLHVQKALMLKMLSD